MFLVLLVDNKEGSLQKDGAIAVLSLFGLLHANIYPIQYHPQEDLKEYRLP
jgi:hypothetical protein